MGKKTGTAGKFATRYGMRLRKKWQEVDERQRESHECPTCNRLAVHRVSSGVWECEKCGAKFAGGAYLPTTGISTSIERAVKRLAGGEASEVKEGSGEKNV